MSAYVVSNKTISVIARGFVEYGVDFYNNEGARIVALLTDATEQLIGQELLKQNVESVNYRYDEHEEVPVFERADDEDLIFNPGILYGCIRCYEYQACETPDYSTSQIHFSLRELQDAICKHLLKAKGYDIPWGYPEPPTEQAKERQNRDREYSFPNRREVLIREIFTSHLHIAEMVDPYMSKDDLYDILLGDFATLLHGGIPALKLVHDMKQQLSELTEDEDWADDEEAKEMFDELSDLYDEYEKKYVNATC